ncbi:MAG TPA: hypothetical protein VKU39_03430 [Streptosporangiaceae bacterium]|nr:hypothetical protein [Streptosporangiaceae bacterium]
MYGRGAVAAGAASALFAPVNIDVFGRIVAVAAVIIGGSLAVRRIVQAARRA